MYIFQGQWGAWPLWPPPRSASAHTHGQCILGNKLIKHNPLGFVVLLITDDGGTIDCIYCDFKKAFDKVPHRRLLKKVESYGIKGAILGWIAAFLSNRTQQVTINGESSEYKKCHKCYPTRQCVRPLTI